MQIEFPDPQFQRLLSFIQVTREYFVSFNGNLLEGSFLKIAQCLLGKIALIFLTKYQKLTV